MMNKVVENEVTVAPQMIELSEMTQASSLGESILSGNLDVVQNVKTRLTVVVGETTISIGELLSMRADQILKLDSLADDPVNILLEGNVVARGQLVAVHDNFGVCITEIPKAGKA
jgi:flagellar motor switch protein FliN/FliY